MRKRLLFVAGILSVAIAPGYSGCSSDGGDTSGTQPTGTGSVSSSSGSGAGGDGSGGQSTSGSTGEGGSIFQGCSSGIVCGSGDCCATGEECVLGACLTACATNVRCAGDLSVCCGMNEVCLADQCAKPTGTCIDWADCAENEFCEPTLGGCLPQPAGAPVCEYKPPVLPLTPLLEWSWTGSAIQPTHNQVINMPVVIDLDKDAIPDVLIVSSDNFSAGGAAYLRALDGATGVEKWGAGAEVYLDKNRVQARSTPAAADIDGDGKVEIVTAKFGGGLIAFEDDGTFKWASTQSNGTTPWTTAVASATIAIADMDADGKAEIVVGATIFESDGKLRSDNGVLSAVNVANYGPVSILADLDGAMPMELVTGNHAYHADGTLYWNNNKTDGYPAIADLDLDGVPEIIVIAGGTVRVQDAKTGAVLASLTMAGAGAGGPPTIANFDADDAPEIAAANGSAYSVYEYAPNPPTLTLKWEVPTQDGSSNRTGSSLFDFQGDGVAEVVYNDECFMRVYNGIDGSELYKEPNSSATIHEYPVIVDVDGDNNTEIVVAANDLNHKGGSPACPYGVNGARHGVFSYGDAGDNWVRTRRIWNQHAYHITNINSDGTLPVPEANSWIKPAGFNNYRQSSQGAGVFNAPDLQVSMEASLSPCPAMVLLRAFVQNKGSVGVGPGVTATFYRGDSAAGTLIGTATTKGTLLPGQYEVVTIEYAVLKGETTMSFYVDVDKDDKGNSSLNECLEDNNAASLGGVECTGIN